MLCPDGNKDKGEELSEKEGDQDQLEKILNSKNIDCLLYTSPSPRD